MDLRILVSRADRIGDLILTLPAISWLKKTTGAHVTLHCSSYAKDIALWAVHNDIVDDILFKDFQGRWNNPVKPFDALLSFFHCRAVQELMKEFPVSKSFGTRTKVSALWTYKKSLAQHRSRVQMSEMQYNLDLAERALAHWGFSATEFTGLAALKVPSDWLQGFTPPRGTIVSVSNGGSAQNWKLGDYLAWVEQHALDEPIDFLVAGLDAEPRKQELLQWAKFDINKHRIVETLPSVAQLVGFLSRANRLVASSTGPLHIAHAAGVDVLGIYPQKRVESFKRWRPDGYWHDGEVRWIEILE